MDRTEEKENVFCWLRLPSGQRSAWERNDLKDVAYEITFPQCLISGCPLVQGSGVCLSPDVLQDMVKYRVFGGLELAQEKRSEPLTWHPAVWVRRTSAVQNLCF